MKNAILPSVSSQLYSFGSISEFISEVPAQMENNTLNLYGESFSYIHSNMYHNQYDFVIPSQFPMDYQSGLSSIMTMKSTRVDCPHDGAAVHHASTCTCVDDSLQSLIPFTKKHSVPRILDDNQAIRNPRKRPIEVIEKEGCVVRNRNKIVDNERKTTSKKVIYQEQKPSQDKKQQAVLEIPRAKLNVRRSQKLSDKITALQKLVSPYGKTDTASVLEEAFISIKLLQYQIQNLLNKLSSSCINSTEHLQCQKTEEKQVVDLHNRGVCLVPVPLTQTLIDQTRRSS